MNTPVSDLLFLRNSKVARVTVYLLAVALAVAPLVLVSVPDWYVRVAAAFQFVAGALGLGNSAQVGGAENTDGD